MKRTLSVRVASDSAQLMTLNRETFTRILGSIKQYLKEDYKNVTSVDGSFVSDSSANKLNSSTILGE